jgi:hypothetical protein
VSPELQILKYIAAGIRRVLKYSETECFVAAAPDYDPIWKPPFIVEVTPGSQSPYDGGNGAQDGGYLLREQNIILHCFHRGQLDAFSKSTMLIVEHNLGLIDRMEAIRQLFDVTSLPIIANPTPTSFVLIEPIKFVGMGKVEWEDPTIKLIRRTLTLLVRYGTAMPESHNLVAADYT